MNWAKAAALAAEQAKTLEEADAKALMEKEHADEAAALAEKEAQEMRDAEEALAAAVAAGE
jgi:hypothetical protein